MKFWDICGFSLVFSLWEEGAYFEEWLVQPLRHSSYFEFRIGCDASCWISYLCICIPSEFLLEAGKMEPEKKWIQWVAETCLTKLILSTISQILPVLLCWFMAITLSQPQMLSFILVLIPNMEVATMSCPFYCTMSSKSDSFANPVPCPNPSLTQTITIASCYFRNI
jgi:hypothetical protein